MHKVKLRIERPVTLDSLVTIHPNREEWDGKTYLRLTNKRGTSAGHTPLRDRASYVTWTRALSPRPAESSLAGQFGIYFLFFSIPSPHLYIGIAADRGRSSEGFLNRLKKHVVKATGSHVGASKGRSGGVDHTAGWREFAMKRAQERRFAHSDTCEDAMLALGQVTDLEGRAVHDKSLLEHVESCLVNDSDDAKSRLATLFETASFECITRRTGRKPSSQKWSWYDE